MEQAFERFEDQVTEGAVVCVGVLAALETVAPLQFGIAVQALLSVPRFEAVLVAAEKATQATQRKQLKFLHRTIPA